MKRKVQRLAERRRAKWLEKRGQMCLADRFKSKVRVMESGCHEWQAYITKGGYGQIGDGYKVLYAHRVAWTLAYSDPGDSYVLHKCDNRKCVNPGHLFLGTFGDNMDDMRMKGRQARGKMLPHTKLSEDGVRAIRASIEKGRVLAKRYGVSEATISMARNRKQWTYI